MGAVFGFLAGLIFRWNPTAGFVAVIGSVAIGALTLGVAGILIGLDLLAGAVAFILGSTIASAWHAFRDRRANQRPMPEIEKKISAFARRDRALDE